MITLVKEHDDSCSRVQDTYRFHFAMIQECSDFVINFLV